MNRYVIEVLVVTFGSIIFLQEFVNPTLMQVHPIFQEPMITYPNDGWSRVRRNANYHLDSALLWVNVTVALFSLFAYGWIRQDKLMEHNDSNNR